MRDQIAAQIHAVYYRFSQAHGWTLPAQEFGKLPKDLQDLNRAMADYVLEREATIKQGAAADALTASPESIATMLETLAGVIRGEKASSVPSVDKSISGSKPPLAEKTSQDAPRFEV